MSQNHDSLHFHLRCDEQDPITYLDERRRVVAILAYIWVIAFSALLMMGSRTSASTTSVGSNGERESDHISRMVAGPGLLATTVSTQTFLMHLPFVTRNWPPIPTSPVLHAIDNTDQDNYFRIGWSSPPDATFYVLEEATGASFADAKVVYEGGEQAWTVASPGKTPASYYYRVKAGNGWGESSWSNAQAVVVHPLFVDLRMQRDGAGYVRGSLYYNIGYHETKVLNGLTDTDTVRSHNSVWYDPNPLDFPTETWDSYYSISTGYFRSSSVPSDPSWKWGCYWLLPYDRQFYDGQEALIDGQLFRVSGPHWGYTTWGQAVQYWQLVNKDKFVLWDGGGDWKQYVHSGDIVLRYDAGNTRLLLHDDVLRRYYYRDELTADTVQYITNLTKSNSFPAITDSSNAVDILDPAVSHASFTDGTRSADRNLLPGLEYMQ